MTTPLVGLVAVVTGATGGIGSAISQCLAEAGASVVVGFRKDDAAARAFAMSLPGKTHASIQADVTDSVSLRRFADEIAARYGKVDILVNSVGTTRFVPHSDLEALDNDFIDEIFRTNWRGPFATIRSLRPLLAKRQLLEALVVNISSIAAVTGIGSNVAYCASKAALNAMTVSLARALAPAFGWCRCRPGWWKPSFVQGLDKAWRDEQTSRTPLGRLARPRDVAEAVLRRCDELAGTRPAASFPWMAGGRCRERTVLERNLGGTLSRFTERWIPDSWVVCMMITVLVLALAVAGAGVSLQAAVLAWGGGMWTLLELSMQSRSPSLRPMRAYPHLQYSGSLES